MNALDAPVRIGEHDYRYITSGFQDDIDTIRASKPQNGDYVVVDKEGHFESRSGKGLMGTVRRRWHQLTHRSELRRAIDRLAKELTSDAIPAVFTSPDKSSASQVSITPAESSETVTEQANTAAISKFYKSEVQVQQAQNELYRELFHKQIPKLTGSAFQMKALPEGVRSVVYPEVTEELLVNLTDAYDIASADTEVLYGTLVGIILDDPSSWRRGLVSIRTITPNHRLFESDIVCEKIPWLIQKAKRSQLTQERAEALLQKSIKIDKMVNGLGVEKKLELEKGMRLTLDDLLLIDTASTITRAIQGWRDDSRLLDEPGISAYLKTVINLARCYQKGSSLERAISDGYKAGQMVLYDSVARQRILGAPMTIQSSYDRYFHAGIVVESPGVIYHALPKVTVSSVGRFAKFATLPAWEVDFGKVFEGWETFTERKKDEIQSEFEGKIAQIGTIGYALKNPTLEDSLLKNFVCSRRRTNNPAKIARKPLIDSAQKTAEYAGAMLCSGFVAGVFHEALDDVRLNRGLALTEEMNVEVTSMTPKDLKRWKIWKVSDSHRGRFAEIMADDVLESSRRLERQYLNKRR